ncbi:hypothetical protein AQUCO_00800082v1 [Aquilegia coerulea]|uniref:Protein kinase domain-containing protein n=1 Tax=Aquilegia coerulea TaxID=218851 RepID=A0A2G5EH49_AQUCA|nr:hypothetical protein AQUCO_00800082v1 [Aquilegia coerulea]
MDLVNPSRLEDISSDLVNKFLSELGPRQYSNDDLMRFTSNFLESNKIGFGGYGDVYKGQFPNGVLIAVKVLQKKDVVEDTFMAEVGTIGNALHRNLVKLYGYCFEHNIKALVYEYMENGSLDKILYENHHSSIEWVKLYGIVIGIANGLNYLHDGLEEQIIHYDIKASNILLDKNFTAKITDFGLAKLINRDVSVPLTRIRGTVGYNAPETWMPGSRVTFKCDVYSFGLMLFEVLGKRSNGMEENWLPELIWKQFKSGKLEHFIKDCGIAEKDKENANILCKVALWCVQFRPELRPSMKDVVLMLEKKLLVEQPPNPFMTFQISTPQVDLEQSHKENIERESSDSLELDPIPTYPQYTIASPSYASVADGKRHLKAYSLAHLLETIHIDNMKILRGLIYAHDDILPLYNGSTKKRVNLEVLRKKNVLLLISDLDIPYEEFTILYQMYSELRPKSSYEVVWLPVVDRSIPWTDEKQKQFERLQFMMPWYSVHHPSLLDPEVIDIKLVSKFATKTMLVMLDPQGRVVNQNAVHMMCIWGSFASPFTIMREEALWEEETWTLQLLVDGIDPNILNWIGENKLICLYGGENIDWIRKFTLAARAVSAAIRTPIEMVYVGKSNPGERVRKNNTIISAEKLSHFWPDLTSIWFFWVRLESMWNSKMQLGKTVENDPIVQEIMTMLSFDGIEEGWAVISKGSAEMTKAKGKTILTSFTDIEQWKELVEPKGFVNALTEYLHQLHT